MYLKQGDATNVADMNRLERAATGFPAQDGEPGAAPALLIQLSRGRARRGSANARSRLPPMSASERVGACRFGRLGARLRS